MRKNNKTCILCGKVYTYCEHCKDFAHLPVWMNIFHEENCKKIFSIATEYNLGNISEDVAKDKLADCDLSNKDNFKQNVKDLIDKLFVKVEEINNETQSEYVDNIEHSDAEVLTTESFRYVSNKRINGKNAKKFNIE